MTGPWRVQDRIQKEGKVGFVNKCWIPLKHYLIKLSAPEKSWVMPSTSFSALGGCPQNINCTWNCDLCGFLFISISYSLIPQHWLPPWYVCCVPAHLHTCLPSSQQRRYENTAFSELYSSRVITLLPSPYLASVASLCFHQPLCPHAYIFFVNLLNSFNQWLFNDFLQWRPQSPLSQT